MLYFEGKSKNSHSGNEKFILHGNQGIFQGCMYWLQAEKASPVGEAWRRKALCAEIRPRKAAGVLHTLLAAQKFYLESATEIYDDNYVWAFVNKGQ
jgi:hypothetical protein